LPSLPHAINSIKSDSNIKSIDSCNNNIHDIESGIGTIHDIDSGINN
jgi:hypothetical protein